MEELFASHLEQMDLQRIVYGLGPLVTYLQEQNIDPAPFYTAAKIPPQSISDPVATMGLSQELIFTHEAIKAVGDLHIDDHHTVEDIGITLGQAFAKAVGDKKGILRYGHAYVPLDEALSRVVIDFSGRPGLEYHIPFTRAAVGGFDVDLFLEFFQGFVNHALVTLHIDNLRGDNSHHQIETVFKAFGRAVRMAMSEDPRMAGVTPSTKGVL